MRSGIALGYDPGAAPHAVIPEFSVEPAGVRALVNVCDEFGDGFRILRIRPTDIRIAVVHKFIKATFPAAGAIDPHGCDFPSDIGLVKIGVRAHALLIDGMAGGKAIEPVRARNLMWFIA